MSNENEQSKTANDDRQVEKEVTQSATKSGAGESSGSGTNVAPSTVVPMEVEVSGAHGQSGTDGSVESGGNDEGRPSNQPSLSTVRKDGCEEEERDPAVQESTSRSKTALVQAACSAGLAVSKERPDTDKENTVPTFTAEWAGVHDTPDAFARYICGILRKKLDGERVDVELLTRRHTWIPTPVEKRSFDRFVSLTEESTRPDMKRLAEVVEDDEQNSGHRRSTLDLWSQLCQDRSWYLIPSTLKCDRTFAKDIVDVYYLDAMDLYLLMMEECSIQEVRVADLPIFKHTLMPRWFTQFKHMKDFFMEAFYRKNFNLMLPFDGYESTIDDLEQLKKRYCSVPDEILSLDLPALVGVPLPPVFYYYNQEIADSGIAQIKTSRIRLLEYVGYVEFCALFVAQWWNHCSHGGRLILVKKETIDVLSSLLGDLELIHGVATDYIFRRMYSGLVCGDSKHNWIHVKPPFLPAATFIHAVKGSGDVNNAVVGGEHWDYDGRSRRMKLSLRHNRRVELRRSSPMTFEVSKYDLRDIPGLLPYVLGKRWLYDESMMVKDLVGNLFHEVHRMKKSMEQYRIEMEDMRYNRDMVLRDRDSAHSRANEAHRQAERLTYNVDDLKADVDSLMRERSDLRIRLDDMKRDAEKARVSKEQLVRTVEVLRYERDECRKELEKLQPDRENAEESRINREEQGGEENGPYPGGALHSPFQPRRRKWEGRRRYFGGIPPTSK